MSKELANEAAYNYLDRDSFTLGIDVSLSIRLFSHNNSTTQSVQTEFVETLR